MAPGTTKKNAEQEKLKAEYFEFKEEVTKQILIILSKLGLKEDGSHNGNGLISKIDKLDNKVKSLEVNTNNVLTELVNINHKFELLEKNLSKNIIDNTNIIENLKLDQERTINDIKEIKNKLSKSITSDMLDRYMRNLVLLAGTITAIGTLLNYLTKFFN